MCNYKTGFTKVAGKIYSQLLDLFRRAGGRGSYIGLIPVSKYAFTRRVGRNVTKRIPQLFQSVQDMSRYLTSTSSVKALRRAPGVPAKSISEKLYKGQRLSSAMNTIMQSQFLSDQQKSKFFRQFIDKHPGIARQLWGITKNPGNPSSPLISGQLDHINLDIQNRILKGDPTGEISYPKVVAPTMLIPGGIHQNRNTSNPSRLIQAQVQWWPKQDNLNKTQLRRLYGGN